MSAHGQPPGHEAEVPATVLGRVAGGIEGFVRPIYRWVGWLGALVILGVTIAMIYSAIGRYVGHPLDGAVDIQRLGLVCMVAFAMGIEHMGHEKMTVDAVVRFLPKRVQDYIAPVIFLLVNAMLVIAVWQLTEMGIARQESGQVTRGTMHLPIWPFIFILVYGMLTLIPIYFARLLRSIDRLVKR